MRSRPNSRWTMVIVALLAAACAPGAGPAPTAPAASSSAAAQSAPTGGPAPATTASPATPVPLPGKVTIAYSSVSGDFLPLWVTTETGLFAKYGLDVDVTYVASGTTA